MDTVNANPPDSHPNVQFMQFRFWKGFVFHYDQAIEPIVYNCHKGSIFVRAQSFKFSRNSFKHTSKYWVHLSSFLSSLIFLWYSDIVKMLKIFAWDISCDILTWVLFNGSFQMFVINYRRMDSTLLIFKTRIPTTKLLKPVSYRSITSASFSSCSIDIQLYGRHYKKTWISA